MVAVEKGELDIVQVLLNKKINVDSRNNRSQTPLMKAAARGYDDILERLLDKGADIDAIDQDGKTAFIHALSTNTNKQIQQTLFDKELGKNRKIHDQTTYNGMTDKRSRKSLADFLIEQVKKEEKYRTEFCLEKAALFQVDMDKIYKALPDKASQLLSTQLVKELKCEHINPKKIKQLLQHKHTDVFQQGIGGECVLHVSINSRNRAVIRMVLEYLFEHKPDIIEFYLFVLFKHSEKRLMLTELWRGTKDDWEQLKQAQLKKERDTKLVQCLEEIEATYKKQLVEKRYQVLTIHFQMNVLCHQHILLH